MFSLLNWDIDLERIWLRDHQVRGGTGPDRTRPRERSLRNELTYIVFPTFTHLEKTGETIFYCGSQRVVALRGRIAH